MRAFAGILSLAAFVLAAAKDARVAVSANGGVTLMQKRSISGKLDQQHLQGQNKIGSGELVRLRTYEGKYLHSDGATVWLSPETNTTTEVLLRSSRAVPAKLQNGDAVLLETRGGYRLELADGSVNVRPKTYRQESQTFLVQRQGGDGDLEEGDPAFLVSSRLGLALAAEGGEVKSRKPDMATGEAFLLEKATSASPPSNWVVLPDPQGHCDPTLECHRRLNVSCRSPNGTELGFQECDHHSRPWSYEPCFRSPLGSCIDVAESDCVDTPGSWWNPEGKTCAEYNRGDCHKIDVVDRACRKTCGAANCVPAKTLEPVGAGCEDDPHYRVPFNWVCSFFSTRNCSAYLFKEELLKACRKSCGVC